MEPEPEAARSSITSDNPLVLREALLALTAINQQIALLDYGNIVIRKDYKDISKVRLLGGGIASRDLSQAIFVGRGMLTAAILGEDVVPSSRLILRTIRELNEGDNCGILVIVQANADLFNFGLAVERANADCRLRVKLLPIDDDRSVNKERYSCGFILLTKMLGAMAEEGVLYNDLCSFYEQIKDQIITVSLNYIDSKTGPRNRSRSIVLHDFESDVRLIIDKNSQANLSLHPSVPLVALINVSKTLERLAELGLVKQVIERLRQFGVCLTRMYYGHFVSAVHGTASLTIMKMVDSEIVRYLDASCGAPGWQAVTQFLPEITLKNEITGLLKHQGKQEIPLKGPMLGESQANILMKSVQFACDALISCERQLNTIDAEKSDGNVGTRLRKFAEYMNKRLTDNTLPISCPYTFLKKIGIIAESAISGTMGSIYGVFFETGANFFGDLNEGEMVTPFMWNKALTVAILAIKQFSTRETAEHNMFYPLRCCEMAINKEMSRDQNYLQCYGMGVSIAEEAAQHTKRPNCKYPDAGAHAVGIWMRAIFEAVKLMRGNDMCGGDNM